MCTDPSARSAALGTPSRPVSKASLGSCPMDCTDMWSTFNESNPWFCHVSKAIASELRIPPKPICSPTSPIASVPFTLFCTTNAKPSAPCTEQVRWWKREKYWSLFTVHCLEWSVIWKVKYVSKPLFTGACSRKNTLPALEGPEGVSLTRTAQRCGADLVLARWMKPACVSSVSRFLNSSLVSTVDSEISTVVSDRSFNTSSLNRSASPCTSP
mmetsp:Transcript_21005/g.46660  ORF Transcript_21005/g.46660 Transcript_21005/m.46660 type:complete len:213 (+) Transcript_21005:803-1441(+)